MLDAWPFSVSSVISVPSVVYYAKRSKNKET
jgi:hypothetical protein